MAWSKLEDSFYDNRKFKRMALTLGIRRAEARGLMAALWSWATTQAPDGDLTDHTAFEIEEAMDWEGDPGKALGAAIDEKLIDDSIDGWKLHKWMPRAGSFRKATQKQKERKEKRELEESEGCRATVGRRSPPRAKSVAGEKRREERNREEKSGEELVQNDSPVAISIPLKSKDGLDHDVTEADVDEWESSFPGLDVRQCLRSFRAWSIASPEKRKTRKGINKAIVRWLTTDNDRGRNLIKGGGDSGLTQDQRAVAEAIEEYTKELEADERAVAVKAAEEQDEPPTPTEKDLYGTDDSDIPF